MQEGHMGNEQFSHVSVNDSSMPVDSFDGAGPSFDGGSTAANKMTIRFGENISPEQRRLSNKVRTTKYTLLSWAPLSLLYQFKRAANVYFLIITILTMMPFSPKRPASMIGTFALVLIFTMLKEAYEDF